MPLRPSRSLDQIQQLKTYAKNIGLAFQVTDDLLDVEGDPNVMGKDVGSDQARSKSTYPALLGIEQSKQFAKKHVNNAMKALDYFEKAIEAGYASMEWIDNDSDLDPIRDHPRFQKAIKNLK